MVLLWSVPYEEYIEGGKMEKGFGDLAHIHEEYAHDKVIVPVTFQEIEGNKCAQTLYLGKGGYNIGSGRFVRYLDDNEQVESVPPEGAA